MERYLVSRYENFAPAILNIKKIKKLTEMPGGRTKVTYTKKREYILREDIEHVRAQIGADCPKSVFLSV